VRTPDGRPARVRTERQVARLDLICTLILFRFQVHDPVRRGEDDAPNRRFRTLRRNLAAPLRATADCCAQTTAANRASNVFALSLIAWRTDARPLPATDPQPVLKPRPARKLPPSPEPIGPMVGGLDRPNHQSCGKISNIATFATRLRVVIGNGAALKSAAWRVRRLAVGEYLLRRLHSDSSWLASGGGARRLFGNLDRPLLLARDEICRNR